MAEQAPFSTRPGGRSILNTPRGRRPLTSNGSDVIVIGAGVVGAACTYFAARAGLKVVCIERDLPCAGSSGACEGNLLLWDKGHGPELALGRLAFEAWDQVATEVPYDFEYHRNKGGIMLIEREESVSAAGAHAKTLAANGVEVELLGAAELRAKEPHVAPDLAGGLFSPTDSQVEPRRATIAYLRGAIDRGAELRTHEPVVGLLDAHDGAIRGVRTAKGEVHAERVVLAAGSWTGEFAESVGLQVPIEPRKGHLLVLERTRTPIRHKLMEASYLDTTQSNAADLQVATVIETTRTGTVIIGSSRARIGFDRTTQPEVIEAEARRAIRFVPALAGLRVIRTYAGLRPYPPDHLPLIGPVPGRPGLFVASGHEGGGVCNSSATGLLISQWLTGQPRSLPDEPFDPGRFAERAEGSAPGSEDSGW
jgi:glycine/D-amino acid oxidase-like deaminating enzyme